MSLTQNEAGVTVYTDKIAIDAGIFTPVVWAYAYAFYTYRHWRWRRRAKNLRDA